MDNKNLSPRQAARRRRAIRNRIIFGAVLLAMLVAVILLCVAIFGGDGDAKPSSSSSAANTDTQGADDPQASQNPFDTTGPVIEGLKDITVEEGGTVSYKSGVTVTDDTDPNPTLDVDASAVDLSVPGTYTVTYTATDASGNLTEEEITVTVTAKTTPASSAASSDGYDASDEDVSYMKYLGGLYLKQIVKDDMSLKEKAMRIWLWVNWNCDYVSTSDKSSWVKGATQYFDTHKGDCFNYYAASRALLELAGIEVKPVVKSDSSHSDHYWCLVNLGDGWYHFDATPRDGGGDYFFLVTDEQIDAYSEAHENSHIFDHNAYPARATAIITDMNAQPDYYDYFKE
ncbi:MAG: transglutaminase domain-containing protein [Lachnospiraceae bacterium]|nr:transglutaminase domain-containing protein [Lachnospiraceae bacterium]